MALPPPAVRAEQLLDLPQQFRALFGVDHVDVTGEAAQVVGEARTAAGLRCNAVLAAVVQDGAGSGGGRRAERAVSSLTTMPVTTCRCEARMTRNLPG